jgi:DNA polymerase III subunit epsilon
MVKGMGLPRFAVVDLETSGLSVNRHRILQVAVVTVEADGTVCDEWESFVRLRWPLGRVGPTHVHGITRSMLRGAPRFAPVLDELLDRISDSLFVGHNARFDGEFLLRAARRQGSLPLTQLEQRLCTLRMSRHLDPDRQLSHRLGDVCARYAVTIDRPHEARADARATAAVLPHLLRAHGVTTPDHLVRFLDRVPGTTSSVKLPMTAPED